MILVFSVNAQSKKEQIENLYYQIDSLNQVVLKEKKINSNSTFEISQLNGELTRLNAAISSLNAEVSKLTSALKSNQVELSKLQEQLNVKSDSLLMIQKEWFELQPNVTKITEELNNLIGTYTSDISQGWTKNFNVTKGKQYLLVVSGQFSLGTICPKFEMDPAYWIPPNNSGNALRNSCNASWYIQGYCNGNLAIRPKPDVYNPLHAYNYVITANSNNIVVGFADTYYVDNCGSITFSLYECLDCAFATVKTSQEDNLKINQPTNPIKTVTIGTQVWMTKNLDVAKFRNGDLIPEAKTNEEWDEAGRNRKPAWCYYNNDPANGAKYGKLYNWYAVNDHRGLAPEGYHIPSDKDWEVLSDYLGGVDVAGKKIKSNIGWGSFTAEKSKTCPNCVDWNNEYRGKVPCHTCNDTRRVGVHNVTISGNGSNSSKFTGLPGGGRDWNEFKDHPSGGVAIWWSSTEGGGTDYYDQGDKCCAGTCCVTSNKYAYYLGYLDRVSLSKSQKEEGFSVRCIKD